MTETSPETPEPVGYRKPPASSRFRKGQSGNPRGRPRIRRKEIPYDHVLGQIVTIREGGRERRVTAAEAFMLQITKRGLEGDSAAARASLAAIEVARSKRSQDHPIYDRIVFKLVSPGSVGSALDALQMAVKLHRFTEHSSYQLKPWLVQLALDRLGDRRLTLDEQRAVRSVTHSPEMVSWPDWWNTTD